MSERLAVVSGGGTGIGAAVARALVVDGCSVLVVSRRAEVLTATVERIGAESGRPEAIRAVTPTSPTPTRWSRWSRRSTVGRSTCW